MKSKIILLLAVFMATNAFALKITNYTQSSNGELLEMLIGDYVKPINKIN